MMHKLLGILMVLCLIGAAFFFGCARGFREGCEVGKANPYDRANLPWMIDIPTRDENMTPITIRVCPYESNNSFYISILKESPTELIENQIMVPAPDNKSAVYQAVFEQEIK